MDHATYGVAMGAFSMGSTPPRVLLVLVTLAASLAAVYGLFLGAYYLLRGSYRALRRLEKQHDQKTDGANADADGNSETTEGGTQQT